MEKIFSDSEKECPLCCHPISPELTDIERVPKNHALVKLFQKNTKFSETCVFHHKNKELICLTDMEMVCTECALFGTHINHSFQKKSEFLKNCE